MKPTFKKTFMFIVLFLAIAFSAMGVFPAYADEGTPPPPATEEPILPPTEEPTQPPVVATEPPVESTPVPEVPEEATPAEDVPVTELLSGAPESTEIVVLDENSEALPLVSQGAAEVLAEADPKWCPAGVLPNGASCSANFPSISALLADMQANPGSYSQHGVIYFERASLTTYTSSFVLDDSLSSLGASYDTLKAFNITLTGGWNGGSGTNLNNYTLFSGPSAFIQVGTNSNPWTGNVTLNNIQVGVSSASGGVSANNSLTVYTSSGNIALNNVDVRQQEGDHYTAYLQSSSGNITIGPSAYNPNSLFDGNNASTKRNRGLSATTGSGSISISGATFQDAFGGSGSGNPDYPGATLSAPIVNLTNVTARSNDGSGIYVNGTGSTIVNVFGGSYTNNRRYGVEVTGSILNVQSAPTCSGNLLGCYNVTPNSPPTVTVNNVTVEGNTLGGWTLAFNAIGSASDAEDGTPSVSCTPANGSLLPVGVTTTVSCTATDSGGLTTTASGNVKVVDTTTPSLSLPSGIPVAATSPAGEVVTFSASATDIVSGAVSVTCVPDTGNTFPLGTTSVSCSAMDGSGNTANGSFNVTVQDTGAPTLTLPAEMSIVVAKPSSAVMTFSASAIDFIEGLVPVICVPSSGSIFPVGTTSVKCSATDGSGNTTSGSFNVTVELKAAEGRLYSIIEQKQDQLPGALEQGNTFGSALKLVFFDKGPKGGITLSFPIPAGLKDAKLAVMLWDGSKWVAVPGGSVVGDYFVIRVTKPGTYMLVSQ